MISWISWKHTFVALITTKVEQIIAMVHKGAVSSNTYPEASNIVDILTKPLIEENLYTLGKILA